VTMNFALWPIRDAELVSSHTKKLQPSLEVDYAFN